MAHALVDRLGVRGSRERPAIRPCTRELVDLVSDNDDLLGRHAIGERVFDIIGDQSPLMIIVPVARHARGLGSSARGPGHVGRRQDRGARRDRRMFLRLSASSVCTPACRTFGQRRPGALERVLLRISRRHHTPAPIPPVSAASRTSTYAGRRTSCASSTITASYLARFSRTARRQFVEGVSRYPAASGSLLPTGVPHDASIQESMVVHRCR